MIQINTSKSVCDDLDRSVKSYLDLVCCLCSCSEVVKYPGQKYIDHPKSVNNLFVIQHFWMIITGIISYENNIICIAVGIWLSENACVNT